MGRRARPRRDGGRQAVPNRGRPGKPGVTRPKIVDGRNTSVMRPFPLLAVLALAGCSGDEAKESSAKPTVPAVGIVLTGKATRVDGIAMSWEGQSVHVGDSWEVAQRVFPEPRRGAYPLRSLPERFGRGFEAHGWESNAGQGYGVVTDDDLVVAAVYHVDGADATHALRLLDAQRGGSGALRMDEIASGDLDWNVWEDGGQRLMVLRDRGAKGIDVTVLMGDANVLDALGATRPTARNAAVAPFLSGPAPGATPPPHPAGTSALPHA